MDISITDIIPISGLPIAPLARRAMAADLAAFLKQQYVVDLAIHNAIPAGAAVSIEISIVDDDSEYGENQLQIIIDADIDNDQRGQLKQTILDSLSWKSKAAEIYLDEIAFRHPIPIVIRDSIYIDGCDLGVGNEEILAELFSAHMDMSYSCCLSENPCAQRLDVRYEIGIEPGFRPAFERDGPEIEIKGSLGPDDYDELRKYLQQLIGPIPTWWDHYASTHEAMVIREWFGATRVLQTSDGADIMSHLRDFIRARRPTDSSEVA